MADPEKESELEKEVATMQRLFSAYADTEQEGSDQLTNLEFKLKIQLKVVRLLPGQCLLVASGKHEEDKY